MKCHSCGSPLDFDSAFCGDCGARVVSPSPGAALTTAKRSPMLAGALVLALMLAAGGAWLLYRRTSVSGGAASAPVLTRAANLLPADTAVMVSWRNPIHSLERLEQSDFARKLRETPTGRSFLERVQSDPGLRKLRDTFEAFDRNRAVFRQFDDFVSLAVVANPAHPDQPDALVLLQGGSALALAQNSGALAKAIEQGGLRTTSERMGDVDLVTTEDPGDPAGKHWFYAVTQSFLVASQERQRVVDTLNRGSVPAALLGAEPGFARASELAPEIDEGFFFVNATALRNAIPAIPPAAGEDEDGTEAKRQQTLRTMNDQLATYQAVAGRIAFRDGGVETEMRAYRAPDAPPPETSGAISGTSYALLPADALFVQAANRATLATIGKAVSEAGGAGAAAPPPVTDGARTIFAELGDEAALAIFEPAAEAPLPIPGFAIVLGPKNAESLPRLEAAVESVIESFVPTGFIGPKEQVDEGGLALTVHSAPGGVSIAHARIGGALVLGSTKELVKRVADVQGGHAPALASRFAASPRLKELFGSADSVQAGYLNWRGVVDAAARAADRPELQALVDAKTGGADWKSQLPSLRTVDFVAIRGWQQPTYAGSTIHLGMSPEAASPSAGAPR